MGAFEGITINALCAYSGAGQTSGRGNAAYVQGGKNVITDKNLFMSSSASTGLIFPELIQKTVNADRIRPETDKSIADSITGGFEDTEEDAAEDIPDIIDGAMFFSDLMNYRSVDLNNTASVTGVRIDTEVVSDIRQTISLPDGDLLINPQKPGLYLSVPLPETQLTQADTPLHAGAADSADNLPMNQAYISDRPRLFNIAGAGLTQQASLIAEPADEAEAFIPQEDTAPAVYEGYILKEETPAPSLADSLTEGAGNAAESGKTAEGTEAAAKDDTEYNYQAAGTIPIQEGRVTDNNPAQADETKMQHSKNKEVKTDNAINTGRTSDIADSILRTIRDFKANSADGKSTEDKTFDSSPADSGKIKEKSDKISDRPFEGSIKSLSDMRGNGIAETAEATEIAEKNTAVEKALSRFANDFRFAETGRNEIKIRLEPEKFGEITISVSKTENGISAKIHSEDKDLCAAVSHHIQKLIDSMEIRGISLKEVDVVYTQAETNLTYNGGSGGEGRHNQYNGNYVYYREAAGEHGRSDFFDQWLTNSEAGSEQAAAAYTVEYRI